MKRERQVLDLLREYESRNVTFMDAKAGWPVVWEKARGVYVWDSEGRRYLDLTAAFGVAAAGHANPAVVKAGARQMGRLLHAMGDVHPHALKGELARALSGLTFGRWLGKGGRGKTIFCSSGFEAVEAALKTALLATDRKRIIAFQGGYHGLGYGALNVTERAHFRGPFRSQLGKFTTWLPFPETTEQLEKLVPKLKRLLDGGKVGAVITEPIQARGGIRIPAEGFLKELRRACDDSGALLVLDEIYTGFGRTGKWFACEHEGVTPDVVALGKALAGGFPISACVGRSDLMDQAWPESNGEAIHTSTFLGHPVGCAMALAQLREIERLRLPEKSAELGEWLLAELGRIMTLPGVHAVVRGRGLMAGIEIVDREGKPATDYVIRVIQKLLKVGLIFLPEGEAANVISFTPPLTLTRAQLKKAVAMLQVVLFSEKP